MKPLISRIKKMNPDAMIIAVSRDGILDLDATEASFQQWCQTGVGPITAVNSRGQKLVLVSYTQFTDLEFTGPTHLPWEAAAK
jgi:hypothetical protein